MAMTTAGVGLQLQLGNSDFLKGLERAKAAAKSLKTDLASIKAPPMPDIGKQIGLQKKQKFESPFGREWEMGLKRGTEKLRIELDRQAALYQQANKRMLPAMNRVQLSGSRVGGNPWMAGAGGRGGLSQRGANTGYGLGVAYNVGQDLAQGGPAAIANQLPQVAQLMQKSKTAKNVGMLGMIAGAMWGTNEFIESGKNSLDDRAEQNQSDARRRALAKRLMEAEGIGGAEGAEIGNREISAAQAASMNDEAYRRQLQIEDENREVQSRIRQARIDAIEDPLKRARAAAEEEKRMLNETYDLMVQRSAKAVSSAAAEQAASEAKLDALNEELSTLKAITNLSEDDLKRRGRLTQMVAAAEVQREMARNKSQGVISENREITGSSELVRSQNQAIDASLQQEIAQISREKGKKLLDTIFDGAQRGLEALGRIAEEAARQKAQAKTRGRMEQELELAELNAGGKTRKARKLERQMNVDSARDKYKEAGYSDADAAAMAEREVVAGEGRGGRIKGAVSKNREKGGSGLDYFDGKKMKGAETSNLDAYRAVPSLRERQKKQAPVQEAPEVTSPVGKGDNAVITLLQDIANSIKAALGVSPAAEQRAGRSIKGATSPNY